MKRAIHSDPSMIATYRILAVAFATMLSLPAVADNPASSPAGARVITPTPAIVIERDYYISTLRAHLILERFVPTGAIVMFGDSLIQRTEIKDVGEHPVANFGIAGDTSAGVVDRISRYKSLKSASAVVLESAVNDLGFGPEYDARIVRNYSRMLRLVPQGTPTYIVGPLPINEPANAAFAGYNARLVKISAGLQSLCKRTLNCHFIRPTGFADSQGNLRNNLRKRGDAVHLSPQGIRLLDSQIANAITDVKPEPVAPQVEDESKNTTQTSASP
ncbi:GDSL-type esterase/lipase family protein [Pandoraea sputorum]|uniref:GDSL-type esterase/lipase family protein n=1 Tax=Pandoraea sputorum TaxID=93222 RepID=UPI001E3FC1EA|nr:GDSL-type esterase/lipase family protein [Pandoraea sputorum]MCE4061546.1 GDSL-type esterase/lipase family protein [Pandoraea sputorum]